MNTRAQSSGKLAKNIKRSIPIYLLALPGLIYLAINNYVPMASLVVAFKNYSAKRGIWGSDWCGFKNFKYLFGTRDAWTITRNTLCYNIAFIVIGTIMTVTIAILLSEIKGKRRGKFYQSAILLPYLVSWVIISYLVFGFLSAENGFINNTILAGLGKEPVSWYNVPKYCGKAWATTALYILQMWLVLTGDIMRRPRSREPATGSRLCILPCPCLGLPLLPW